MRRCLMTGLGLLMALSVFAVPSSADPVTVAGTVFVWNFGANFQSRPTVKLILFGPAGMYLSAGWNENEWWTLYPGGITVDRQPTAGPGQSYNLSTHVSFTAGSGFTNTTGGYVPIDADLTVQAGTGILQTIDGETPAGTDLAALAQARMFGVIRGFDPNTHALLFEDQIQSRRGSARVLLSTKDPAVFDFVFGSSTPEPGTILLLATGLGLLAFVPRRRRADPAH